MNIIPYRFRWQDLSYDDPVEVYRNVNKKGVVYSIRQFGYVVAHATELVLVNAEFIVKESGRKRVKKTGRKNVHAWVRGDILKRLEPSESSRLKAKVLYNPKKNDSFVLKNGKLVVKSAPLVVLNDKGVFVDTSVGL